VEEAASNVDVVTDHLIAVDPDIKAPRTILIHTTDQIHTMIVVMGVMDEVPLLHILPRHARPTTNHLKVMEGTALGVVGHRILLTMVLLAGAH
jgi:hypothetical protein